MQADAWCSSLCCRECEASLTGFPMILILEDRDDRIRQFLEAASRVAPQLPVMVWRSAPAMIAGLVGYLESASIISLDHDLDSAGDESGDPGTGYDVAKYLGELIPVCPVIVHTSNAERRNWMIGALSLGHWEYDCVYPDGDAWISERWAPLVRRRLSTQGN